MRLKFGLAGLACVMIALVIGVILLKRNEQSPIKTEVTLESPQERVANPLLSLLPQLPEAVFKGHDPIVAWSAHTAARFEPCGCTAGMYGGLVRRAGLLSRIPNERQLSLELGGWTAGKAEHLHIRGNFYVRALANAGIDVIGVGTSEVALGATILKSLLLTEVPPLVSANVRFDDNKTDVKTFAEITAGGEVFIVTSVVPRTAHGDGLQIVDPVDAITKVAAVAQGRKVVVMADMSEEELQTLAGALPSVSLIVGGAVTSPSQTPLSVGAVRVVHVANHGKTIGYWRWGSDACHFDLIHDMLPDSPDIRGIVSNYQKHLGTIDLDSDKSTRTGGFVGDAACITCHAQAAQVHGASKHAHAFASLEKRGYQHDPDCLRCHVTGLGYSDGFQRRVSPPNHAQVSCESCHGPGAAHVAAGGQQQPMRPVGVATCMQCHDEENSPKFNYQTYWQQIKHGK